MQGVNLVVIALLGVSLVDAQWFQQTTTPPHHGHGGHFGLHSSQCLSNYQQYFPQLSGSNLIVDFSVHYRCPPGTTLQGGDEIAVCQDGSTTSGPRFPVCVPIPPPPPCPKKTCDDNLDVLDATITNLRYRNVSYDVGTIVKYKCKDELTHCLIGLDTRTCQPDGTWSAAPRCQLAKCSYQEVQPRYGSGVKIQSQSKADPTNSYYYHGAHVQYCCEPNFNQLVGYSLVECRCDSTWSGTPPTCNPNAPPPVVLPPAPIQPPCQQQPAPPQPPCTYQQNLWGHITGQPCQVQPQQSSPCQQQQQGYPGGYPGGFPGYPGYGKKK